jgi:tetratricopeptide (TPR) repeat protein
VYLRATARMHPMTLENCDAAIALLDEAIAADPGFGPALGAAAWCRMWRAAQDPAGATAAEEAEMVRLAEAALAAAPDDPAVLAQASLVFNLLGHRAQATLDIAERAVSLHPNSGLARAAAGWVQLHAGTPEAAAAHFEASLRVDPLDPASGEPMAGIAMARLLEGRLGDAVAWGERAAAASPANMTAHRALVAALGAAGRPAAAEVARMLALRPGFTLAGYARLRRRYAAHPLQRALVEGMRRTGVPEGSPEEP